MSNAATLFNLIVSIVTICTSTIAIVRTRRVARMLEAENGVLASYRDKLRADRDAERSTPAGKRLLAELDRVQSMQFGVPMARNATGRGSHPVVWDAPVETELSLRQSIRSSRSRT